MKKRDKKMIREISAVLTEDIVKMIEDMEKIQKKYQPKTKKVRRHKKSKVRPVVDFYDLSDDPEFIDISDIRLTPPPF